MAHLSALSSVPSLKPERCRKLLQCSLGNTLALCEGTVDRKGVWAIRAAKSHSVLAALARRGILLKAGTMPSAADLPDPPPLADLLAERKTAVFLDFDGTLVALAETPDGIEVADDLPDRLNALAQRLDGRLALVTGRAIVDLESHIGPVELCCAGSHGADVRDASGVTLGDAAKSLSDHVVNQVEGFARDHGLRYEAKSHGAALHSRERPELAERAAAFLDELAEDEGLAVSHGKSVAEILHSGTNKGTAVEVILQTELFIGARPIFLGDDVTDEDGFAAVRAAGGIAIAVGERAATHADYGLADVAAVHHWLDL